MTGISSNPLANMKKNEYISMKNLELICRKMTLSPNEVIEFRVEEGELLEIYGNKTVEILEYLSQLKTIHD